MIALRNPSICAAVTSVILLVGCATKSGAQESPVDRGCRAGDVLQIEERSNASDIGLKIRQQNSNMRFYFVQSSNGCHFSISDYAVVGIPTISINDGEIYGLISTDNAPRELVSLRSGPISLDTGRAISVSERFRPHLILSSGPDQRIVDAVDLGSSYVAYVTQEPGGNNLLLAKHDSDDPGFPDQLERVVKFEGLASARVSAGPGLHGKFHSISVIENGPNDDKAGIVVIDWLAPNSD